MRENTLKSAHTLRIGPCAPATCMRCIPHQLTFHCKHRLGGGVAVHHPTAVVTSIVQSHRVDGQQAPLTVAMDTVVQRAHRQLGTVLVPPDSGIRVRTLAQKGHCTLIGYSDVLEGHDKHMRAVYNRDTRWWTQELIDTAEQRWDHHGPSLDVK